MKKLNSNNRVYDEQHPSTVVNSQSTSHAGGVNQFAHSQGTFTHQISSANGQLSPKAVGSANPIQLTNG